jgi:hypothetical protein
MVYLTLSQWLSDLEKDLTVSSSEVESLEAILTKWNEEGTLFPLEYIGEGYFAKVYKTGRNSVLRHSVVQRDLGFDYLRICFEQGQSVYWLPKVLCVERYGPLRLGIVERELLHTLESATNLDTWKTLVEARSLASLEERLAIVAGYISEIEALSKSKVNNKSVLYLPFIYTGTECTIFCREHTELAVKEDGLDMFLAILKKVVEQYEGKDVYLDLSLDNFLYRMPTQELVIADPFLSIVPR